jgi:hypothetical protein
MLTMVVVALEMYFVLGVKSTPSNKFKSDRQQKKGQSSRAIPSTTTGTSSSTNTGLHK